MINFLSGVAATAAAFLLYLHFTRGAVPASNGLVDSILAGFRAAADEFVVRFVAEVQKLPAMISAEVASLKDQLTAMKARAETAEASLAQEVAARGDILKGVQAQLQAAIATGLTPSSTATKATAGQAPVAAIVVAAPAPEDED